MFKIAHLYPTELNLYGDTGNIYYLQYFLNLFNISSTVFNITSKTKKLNDFDFIFAGGGPDSLQNKIYKDFLENKKDFIKKHIENNKPALFICGSYQLLGKYYLTADNKKIKGLNIFDFYTASPKDQKHRIVGNTSAIFKELSSDFIFSDVVVGFENHNGRTYLNDLKSFGIASKKTQGNNKKDLSEGFVYKKTIGSYLHGPLLVKNPHIAYFLLQNYISLKELKKVDLKMLFPEYLAHRNILNNYV